MVLRSNISPVPSKDELDPLPTLKFSDQLARDRLDRLHHRIVRRRRGSFSHGTPHEFAVRGCAIASQLQALCQVIKLVLLKLHRLNSASTLSLLALTRFGRRGWIEARRLLARRSLGHPSFYKGSDGLAMLVLDLLQVKNQWQDRRVGRYVGQ